MIASESVGEALERAVLPGEDGEHLVRLAQRRVRALDDLRELVAPRREAGAEVVQDQAEAVRIGLAHDVVDQVEVDRLAVLLERQEALALAAARPRGSPRAPAAARCPAPGAAWARTPRTSRPGATAGGSCRTRPRGSPGSRDRRSACTTTALPGLGAPVGVRRLVGEGDVELGDGADVGARDPDVLVGRQEGGVVEDRADLVGVARRPAPDATTRSVTAAPIVSERSGRCVSWAGRDVAGIAVTRSARRRRGTGGPRARASPALACVAPPGHRVNGPRPSAGYASKIWLSADRVEVLGRPRPSRTGSSRPPARGGSGR